MQTRQPPCHQGIRGDIFGLGLPGFFQVLFAAAWSSPFASLLASMRGPDVATFRGILPLAALIRSLFVKATGPNRTAEHKKKTMNTKQTQKQKSDEGSWPARTVGHEQSTKEQQSNKSYSLLPTPQVSGMLKATSTGRLSRQAFSVEGRETENAQQSKKKDYENEN